MTWLLKSEAKPIIISRYWEWRLCETVPESLWTFVLAMFLDRSRNKSKRLTSAFLFDEKNDKIRG